MALNQSDITQLAGHMKGVLKAADLTAAGLSYKQIRQLITSGVLEKISRGMYRFAEHPYDERLEIARRIPSGVFCLYSACILHQLSDFVSSEQHLAVPKKSRYVLPKYPPVKLYYWDMAAFQLGIQTYDLEGSQIRVYDPEKTLCDMVRLRSKIGMELVKEVMKKYLARPDRNLSKVHEYARQLRVEKPINQFLTILL